MAFSFRFLETDLDGNITKDVPLSIIPGRISVYDTVGDERFLEAGDLTFSLIEPLPFESATGRKWVALYWDGGLYNVYRAVQPYNKIDEKRNIYKSTRLESIQSTFFQDITLRSIYRLIISPELWSFNLTAAKVVIDKIRSDNNVVPEYISDRWAFSVGDMLSNMIGKSDKSGYSINSLSHSLPLKNQNNLPILFRGQSQDEGVSELTAVHFTFGENKWVDIFKIALYSYNSYLRVSPVVSGGKLKIDVDMTSKKQADTSGAYPVNWIERERINSYYRIDGVKLAGENFEFVQGDSEGNFTFSQSLPVSDPETKIAPFDKILYWAAGDYNSGIGQYEILDINEQNIGFYKSGAIEPNYTSMITENHGYNGKMLFSGQKPLDKVLSGSNVIQLTKVNVNQYGIATVEGILL